MTIIGDESLSDGYGQVYVDNGEVRISVLKHPDLPTAVRSYGLDGDLQNAKDYAEALAEAIRIADKWEKQ